MSSGAWRPDSVINPGGPAPGEHVCFSCPLPNCKGHKHPQCPLRAARAAWKADLRQLIDDALEGERVFTIPIPNSQWHRSTYFAAAKMVPEGTRVHTELLRDGSRWELRVELHEAAS